MPEPTSACPVCGTPARHGSARLDLDLDVELDLDLDGGPGGVAWAFPATAVRRRGRRGRRWLVGGVAGLAAVAMTANALADGPRRPEVLPVSASTTTPTGDTADDTVDDAVDDGSMPTGPLLGEATGLALVVLDAPDLAALDLDTGRVATLDSDLVVRSAGGPVVATSVGLAVVDRDGGVSVWAPDETAVRQVFVPAAGRRAAAVLGEDPSGRLWVVVGDGRGADEVGTVALDGRVGFDVAAALPAGAAVRSDGAGGVVVGAPGGVYRVVPGAPAVRVAGGDLVDARAGRVLTRECDEALACAWQVLDLAGADRWRVAVPAGEPGIVTLTPDGGRLVHVAPAGPGADAAVGLIGPGGETVELGTTTLSCDDVGCRPSMVWSPDGRWLVAVNAAGAAWGWRDGLVAPVAVAVPGPGGGVLGVASPVALTTVRARGA